MASFKTKKISKSSKIPFYQKNNSENFEKISAESPNLNPEYDAEYHENSRDTVREYAVTQRQKKRNPIRIVSGILLILAVMAFFGIL